MTEEVPSVASHNNNPESLSTHSENFEISMDQIAASELKTQESSVNYSGIDPNLKGAVFGSRNFSNSSNIPVSAWKIITQVNAVSPLHSLIQSSDTNKSSDSNCMVPRRWCPLSLGALHISSQSKNSISRNKNYAKKNVNTVRSQTNDSLVISVDSKSCSASEQKQDFTNEFYGPDRPCNTSISCESEEPKIKKSSAKISPIKSSYQVPKMSKILSPKKNEKVVISVGRQQTMLACRHQIEYYFGVENLCRDIYLRRQMAPETGWVPISLLLSFNCVRALCANATFIVESIDGSSIVEVDAETCSLIRRRGDWKNWIISSPDATSKSGKTSNAELDIRVSAFCPKIESFVLVAPLYKVIRRRIRDRSSSRTIFFPSSNAENDHKTRSFDGTTTTPTLQNDDFCDSGKSSNNLSITGNEEDYAPFEFGSKIALEKIRTSLINDVKLGADSVEIYPAAYSEGNRDLSFGWFKLPSNEGQRLTSLNPINQVSNVLSSIKNSLLNESGFEIIQYTRFLDRALSERMRLGTGRAYEINVLFRFWQFSLPRSLSRPMYDQFKLLATEDAACGNRYGLECLYQFYATFMLQTLGNIPDEGLVSLALSDFQQLTLADFRAGYTYGLDLLYDCIKKLSLLTETDDKAVKSSSEENSESFEYHPKAIENLRLRPEILFILQNPRPKPLIGLHSRPLTPPPIR